MYTSLSGLNASQQKLDVIGNNIANVNTLAYKSSRAIFQTQLSQTISGGTPPNATSGGTNPLQIGLGAGTGSIQKDMSDGSIETTGVNSDIAIQGSGFFVLQDMGGNTVYSRDGAFQLDANQNLVNTSGAYVMGYPIDDRFNLLTGNTSSINIPLGQLSVAQATKNVSFTGNLSSASTVATVPGYSTSEALVDTTSGNPAAGATLLTNLATAVKPGINVLAVGDVITLDASNGQGKMAPATFTVTAAATGNVDSGSTVAEYMEWLQAHMSVDPTAPQNPPAGASIANGQITLTGNLGLDNLPAISITSSGAVQTPFIWTSTIPDSDPNTPGDDIGSGISTSFIAYDSLGTPVNVNLTFAMIEKGDGINTWRFYAESPDDSDASNFLGTGTISFDDPGNFLEATGNTVTLNRAGTGATDPITLTLDFSQLNGLYGDNGVSRQTQDGCSAGTLNNYSIAGDGTVIGSFSNGMSKPLGQIVVADFSNPAGLIAQKNNTYIAGPNSGEGNIVTPGANGTGTLIGGALELSNVDITEQFINMVSASTAFSAAGKVITTSQELLKELMNIVR
jgi:flagellar hook protein FlgE